MIRKLVQGLVAVVFLSVSTIPALAVVRSGPEPPGTVDMSATLVNECTVLTNGTLNFGNYVPNGVPFNSTSATVVTSSNSTAASMRCTKGTKYSITPDSTSGNMKGTAHPSALLPYTYNVLGSFDTDTDSAGNITCPMSPSPNTASGTAGTSVIKIFFGACLNPGMWPVPDTYTDQFTFTVIF